MSDPESSSSSDEGFRDKGKGGQKSDDPNLASKDLEDGWSFVEHEPNNSKDPSQASKKKSGHTSLSWNGGLKNRVYCAMYNMYHPQPTDPPHFSSSPIWMMGRSFVLTQEQKPHKRHHSHHSSYSKDKDKEQHHKKKRKTPEHAERFIAAFSEMLYFSYRKDFPKLYGLHVTSDVGWGCMVRTGQMMLARSLVLLMGEFDQDLMTSVPSIRAPYSTERKIIRWFGDWPDPKHHYGIHNIIEKHANLFGIDKKDEGKGIWFSPTKISKVLKHLVRSHCPEEMTMLVPHDGVIYVDKVISLCTATSTKKGAPSSPLSDWTVRKHVRPIHISSIPIPISTSPSSSALDRSWYDLKKDAKASGILPKPPSYNPFQSAYDDFGMVDTDEDDETRAIMSHPIGGPDSGPKRDIAQTLTKSSHVTRSGQLLSPETAAELRRSRSLSLRGVSDANKRTRDAIVEAIKRSTSNEDMTQLEHRADSPPHSGIMERRVKSHIDLLELDSDEEPIRMKWHENDTKSSSGRTTSPLSKGPPSRASSAVLGTFSMTMDDDDNDEYDASDDDEMPSETESDKEHSNPGLAMSSSSIPHKSKINHGHSSHAGSTKLSSLAPANPPEEKRASSYNPSSPSMTTPKKSATVSTPTKLTVGGGAHGQNNHGRSELTSSGKFKDPLGVEPPSPEDSDSDDNDLTPTNYPSSPPHVSAPRSGEQHADFKYWSINYTPQPIEPTSPRNNALASSSIIDRSDDVDGKQQQPKLAPTWRPLFILIPRRLGVDKLNHLYIPHLKALMKNRFSVGIVGGKPKASLYFVGFQDDQLFYFDPHFVRQAVKPDDDFTEDTYASFHARIPQKLPLTSLDPSMALGFFIRTLAEFEEFCNIQQKFAEESKQETIFTIEERCPDYVHKKNRVQRNDPKEDVLTPIARPKSSDKRSKSTQSDKVDRRLHSAALQVGASSRSKSAKLSTKGVHHHHQKTGSNETAATKAAGVGAATSPVSSPLSSSPEQDSVDDFEMVCK